MHANPGEESAEMEAEGDDACPMCGHQSAMSLDEEDEPEAEESEEGPASKESFIDALRKKGHDQ